jgi:myo-inositol-1(or 4)-monophosphatase
MSRSALSQLSSIAERAASTARNATPAFVDEKSAQDFVTDMDRGLQLQISVALEQSFPNIEAIGEEGISADLHLPDKAFLIDPLDGTGNWVAGLPFSAVSIAYLEQGNTVMAVVAAIAGNDVYSVELGKGAWRNGNRLQVSGPPPALIALSSGVVDAAVRGDAYCALRRFGKLRNLGSQALQLCAVAQGSLALNASVEARLWDDAAGRLIATEAGALYRANVSAADARSPVICQQSLCAHPDVFDAASIILGQIFVSNNH